MIAHRVDLYVSSFPLGGGRAAVEVMGSGTPMVMHQGYASRFHGGADLAYPEALCWGTPGELHHHLQALTAESLAEQAANARRYYERYYTSDKLSQELTRIDEETPGLRPEPLRAYRPDAIQIYLDQVNLGFAYWSNRLDIKEQEVHGLQATLHTQQQEIDRIHASLGWRLICRIEQLVNRLLPSRTGRRKTYDRLLRAIRVIISEGWIGFLKRAKHQVFRGEWSRNLLYELWVIRNEPKKAQLEGMRRESQSWSFRPKISIVTPVYNPNRYDLTQCIGSVIEQTYDNWELCLVDGASDKPYVADVIKEFAKRDPRIKAVTLPRNLGIVGNSNAARLVITGEYVAFLDHDDMLAPFALHEVVKRLNQDGSIDFLYSDEDKVTANGRRRYDPTFKPDWSPDTLLSCNYVCHFAVARRSIIDEVGWFREGYDGSQDHDLILRVSEKTSRIKRIPKILYHWRAAGASVASDPMVKPYAYVAAKKSLADHLARRAVAADVIDGMFIGSYRVKYRVRPYQRVSIIIPTKDRADLLGRCVTSVLEKTTGADFEVVIVDNQSREGETHRLFEQLRPDSRVRILGYDEPFNFSAINNFAVRSTDSDHVVFLNNDTEVISGEWLTAMLEFSQRPDVGAVGARLYYPDRTIQHAGVIIGMGGVAGHAFRSFSDSIPGYMGRIKIIQNLSAVTAACMMMRRDVFDEVGGFDDRLAHAFNDIDLCLKVRDKGYLIVYTPYAELFHHESASRGPEDTPERKARFAREVEIMSSRWKHVFEAGDPYYNPNLTLTKLDFSVRY
jgi:GT2 family glycosyltransferase